VPYKGTAARPYIKCACCAYRINPLSKATKPKLKNNARAKNFLQTANRAHWQINVLTGTGAKLEKNGDFQ